ncbi:MAG: F0F1 ATP synthase subunit B [Alphaproteobacteria bacterium]
MTTESRATEPKKIQAQDSHPAAPAGAKQGHTAAAGHAQAVPGPFHLQAEFWVAVAFFIVVGFAGRRVVQAVTSALDARGRKIKGKLEEARQLRDDAQAMLVEYQRKQRDVLKEAEAIVAKARADALRHKKESAAELEEAIKRREAQAMARIAQAEAQAVAEVRNTAVDIAMAATRRLIGEHMTPAQASAMVDQSIKDLPARLLQ